jgi:spore coat protein U-like protein
MKTAKLLFLMLLCLPVFAQAQIYLFNATTTFQVTATVKSVCTVAATAMNFGTGIDPLTAPAQLDATATVTLRCTNSTDYAVSLDAGLHAGGAANFTARAMNNGSTNLGYQLYTDVGRNTVWGNGTASSTIGGTGTGSFRALTVYGRMPMSNAVAPGVYADTVTVTVSY